VSLPAPSHLASRAAASTVVPPASAGTQVGRLLAEHPSDVHGAGRVAAQAAADRPQVAGVSDRFRRLFRHIVGIVGRGGGRVGEEFEEIVLGEPGEGRSKSADRRAASSWASRPSSHAESVAVWLSAIR